MLADKGYDADWYREALEDKRIAPCIPSRKGRKVPSHTTKSDIKNATKSRTALPALKTGGGSQIARSDRHHDS